MDESNRIRAAQWIDASNAPYLAVFDQSRASLINRSREQDDTEHN